MKLKLSQWVVFTSTLIGFLLVCNGDGGVDILQQRGEEESAVTSPSGMIPNQHRAMKTKKKTKKKKVCVRDHELQSNIRIG